MADSAWPFVAVLSGIDPKSTRVVGTWAPNEKQIALDWSCNWWQMMFGHEPQVVESHGEFSDDQYAVVTDRDCDLRIVVSQLGDAYRTDAEVVS